MEPFFAQIKYMHRRDGSKGHPTAKSINYKFLSKQSIEGGEMGRGDI